MVYFVRDVLEVARDDYCIQDCIAHQAMIEKKNCHEQKLTFVETVLVCINEPVPLIRVAGVCADISW